MSLLTNFTGAVFEEFTSMHRTQVGSNNLQGPPERGQLTVPMIATSKWGRRMVKGMS